MVFHDVPYGVPVTTAPMLLQVEPPREVYWNWTLATPEPESLAEPARPTAPPLITALALGVLSEATGAVLSIRTPLTVGDVNVLPTRSVMITRKLYVPSLKAFAGTLAVNGADVPGVPTLLQKKPKKTSYCTCTLATPDPMSAALVLNARAPCTLEFAAGDVIAPVGAVPSTANVSCAVLALPTASAAVTVYAPGDADPFGARVNVVDAYGPPAGVLTV